MTILFQSGEGTSEAGAMETESTEESQPSSSSGGAEEGATPSTSTITPPTEEMEALYSEMDALNKLADYCVLHYKARCCSSIYPCLVHPESDER